MNGFFTPKHQRAPRQPKAYLYHMRYPSIRRRFWARKYARLTTSTAFTPGGGVTLDLSELFTRLAIRSVLKQAGIQPGNV